MLSLIPSIQYPKSLEKKKYFALFVTCGSRRVFLKTNTPSTGFEPAHQPSEGCVLSRLDYESSNSAICSEIII